MRQILIIFGAILFGTLANAQKVKEKDIIGTWKLVINIEDEMKEEADEADTMLEEVFIKAISGFVDGIIDDIEIYFDFRDDKELRITVYAYDEKETEYGRWFINKKGFLEVEDIDDDDHFNIDSDDDEWKLIDGILVTDEYEETRTVYMTKVN